MLQNLLVERFKLAAHRETKQVSGYSLVVAKGGPKLKVWTEGSPHAYAAAGPPPEPGQRPSLAPDGFPITISLAGRGAERGILMFGAPYGWKIFYFGKTMHDLADDLWERLSIPVTDTSGLDSKYDFTLTYLPDDRPEPAGPTADGYPPASNMFKAVESQLGLRLEKRKVTVEMPVIDHIERTPSEN